MQSVIAAKGAGIALSAESQAILALAKPQLDHAETLKAGLPSGKDARIKYAPTLDPSWPSCA